ncbi:hypothetical protein DDB_G0289765 [Dictyostelium discoideum AX4]|uniref:Putative uncharacterized protein DDB_G0289765 n=1 Tax=Dictyostelium discoideum TaxID=44689 RepID=Y8570_DICDI|nr:hypothetical protein DDB_G0289765 [Dictyostelium discoideum AX4]Q54H11.1 RecName: Full=Putative uncharacterized protein DDB_G0289765 [Dictyostelium discoideum]EAL62594.1 hypothetical protein DDB_G0289765 [Dictyostelium discoideum AX4]|eukprot:XP_636107.1 hypothetical protein DDB_G0289765 [Dictyostelium discoideum AX4]
MFRIILERIEHSLKFSTLQEVDFGVGFKTKITERKFNRNSIGANDILFFQLSERPGQTLFFSSAVFKQSIINELNRLNNYLNRPYSIDNEPFPFSLTF